MAAKRDSQDGPQDQDRPADESRKAGVGAADDFISDSIDELVDDAVRAGQDAILRGARRLQRSYRAIREGRFTRKVANGDPHRRVLGAGVGAGLGAVAGVLLRLHPAGRVATVVGGALAGVVAAGLTDPDQPRRRRPRRSRRTGAGHRTEPDKTEPHKPTPRQDESDDETPSGSRRAI